MAVGHLREHLKTKLVTKIYSIHVYLCIPKLKYSPSMYLWVFNNIVFYKSLRTDQLLDEKCRTKKDFSNVDYTMIESKLKLNLECTVNAALVTWTLRLRVNKE